MANFFTLSPPLQPSATGKAGWLKPTESPRPPNLAIVRDPARRIRQAVRDDNVSLLVKLGQKYALRNADRSRMTSLSWAAVEGNLKVFEWLLMDYAHDDSELSRDYENNTILHVLASLPSPGAAFARNPLLPPLVDNRPKEEVHAVALHMASLYYHQFPFLQNWCNAAGKTPMHIAAQLGHTPMVQFLIDVGADQDMMDAQGNSALHYASAYGHTDTLKVLLESGCSFNGRNAEGYTAADFAFTERVFVELESTARAVLEGRKRYRRDERRVVAPEDNRTEPTRAGRLRSGSVSTAGSALGSNTGSNGSSQQHTRQYQGYSLSSGSPNLLDRDQYLLAAEAMSRPPAIPGRSNTPPTLSRHSSEALSERSSSRGLTASQSTAPPVPPLPAGIQPPRPPHRSPSLPVHPAVQHPMALPLPADGSQTGSMTMRRAHSDQVDGADGTGHALPAAGTHSRLTSS